jgi:hypothetical protein
MQWECIFRKGLMATQRQPKYPRGLDKVAEQFGITTPQLLEEIANGELVVVRRPHSEEGDFDFDTQEGVLAGLREGWRQAMNDETIPLSEVYEQSLMD